MPPACGRGQTAASYEILSGQRYLQPGNLFLQIPLTGTVELKDHSVVCPLAARFMRSPADVQRTQRGTEPYKRRVPPDAVGDELRTGKKIQKRIMQDKASCDRLTVSGIVAERGGQLTPDKMSGMHAKPGDDQGIEAFDADVPAVSIQESFGLFTEFPVSGTVF